MIEELTTVLKNQVEELEREDLSLAFETVTFCKKLENLNHDELLAITKVLALSIAISSLNEDSVPSLYV